MRWLYAAGATLLLLASFSVSTHAAQKVGVAAAVNQDALASGQVINIGKSLFFNERVSTSDSGLVQVLLIDGSTFTVGPNSDLVIDRFVYDPARGRGEMVATFSKGALRFIGGKLSKRDGGVTINTPEGALAVRGGITQIQVNAGGAKFLFDFGDHIQLTGNNGETHTVFQPGNTIDVTGGYPFVRPTTREDSMYFLTQLTSQPGQTGGADGGPDGDQVTQGMGGQGAGFSTPPPIEKGQTNTQIFTVKIEDATTDRIEGEIIEQINSQTPPENDPPPDDNPPVNDPPPDNNPPPPPTEVQVHVLTSPDVFTSYPGQPDEQIFPQLPYADRVYLTEGGGKSPYEGDYDWTVDPGDRGILGGDNFNPKGGAGPVTSDDFVTRAKIADGFLTGTVQLVSRGDLDCDVECDFPEMTVLEPLQEFSFSFSSTPGIYAAIGTVTDVVDGVVQADTNQDFIGSQVVANGFFAYQMYGLEEDGQTGDPIPDFSNPLLMISGQEYALPDRGRLHSIELLSDPRENQEGFVVPFASAAFMPEAIPFPDQAAEGDVLPAVSKLLLLEQDDEPGSQPVWLQTSFYIGTDSESDEQESFVVVALGGVEERDGFDALVGDRRGGSRTGSIITDPCDGECEGDYAHATTSFAGGVATLAGGEGAHLMGSDGANLVIGADSTGPGHELFIDRPVQNGETYPGSDHQFASYHIGTESGVESIEQTDADLKGYAVGMVESARLGNPNIVMSDQPSDVTFAFDAETNTLEAAFRVYDEGQQDGAVGSYELGFGGISESGKSAFIDNQRFAAIENLETTSVHPDDGEPWAITNAESWLASGDQLQVTNFFPAVFEETEPGSGVRPFCQDCDFIKWGAWGTRVQFGDSGSESAQYDDNVHMGWWVAGDITSAADLDALGESNMSATYNGHAIGNVLNNGRNYIAAGDMEMGWDFGTRTGDWGLTNFDSHAFGGAMSAPGAIAGNHFGGPISGSGLTGSAAGSFVNDSAGNAARGVIGNFNVGNGDNYYATGIFAGSGTPRVPR